MHIDSFKKRNHYLRQRTKHGQVYNKCSRPIRQEDSISILCKADVMLADEFGKSSLLASIGPGKQHLLQHLKIIVSLWQQWIWKDLIFESKTCVIEACVGCIWVKHVFSCCNQCCIFEAVFCRDVNMYQITSLWRDGVRCGVEYGAYKGGLVKIHIATAWCFLIIKNVTVIFLYFSA